MCVCVGRHGDNERVRPSENRMRGVYGTRKKPWTMMLCDCVYVVALWYYCVGG